MDKYSSAELTEFLRSVDRHLEHPFQLMVIGGTAVSLGYARIHTTSDIDILRTNADLLRAFECARRTTGRPIPESQVGVYTAPLDFEDRWTEIPLGVQRLRVFVPERHDLAIMKVARADEHDLEAIEKIHATRPLELTVLLERYRSTLPFVIGSSRDFEISLLALVERLFGEARAMQLERELGARSER